MVQNVLGITSDSNYFADSINDPKEKTATINGLENVKTIISNWNYEDFAGEINFTAIVRKNDLVSTKSPFNIKISGFKIMTIQYVLNQLKNLPKGSIGVGKSALTVPYNASNLNNAQLISSHVSDISPIYESIYHDLTYTGPLQVGDNNIEVFYKGIDQNFTISVEVDQI